MNDAPGTGAALGSGSLPRRYRVPETRPGGRVRGDEPDDRARRRLPSLVLGGLAVVVALAFAAALLVLPIRAWMNQRSSLSASRADLEALEAANADLQSDINRLQSAVGTAQAAREDLGMVRKRERAYRVLALPQLTNSFPDAWLYPTITSLITERIAVLGAATSEAQSSNPVSSGGPAATSTAASTPPAP